ncbi:ATP-dependent RNA helicase DDX24 [Hyposmocoma kahamanoa]|uniref:ATP-dependent RNA helicase DDX24 n=1 Tax=Hyposmocoma kahamanoa TaxID=1477025 RepID=UPI000E6D5B43|nr:ATP-dependent RNA helicase DDX24 [Hyposmocoma kahamanoa]
MSKKLKNLKWNTVALEGFPASVTQNLQGFVGLEECTTYGMDKESKRPKKKKVQNKRKIPNYAPENEIPNKKVKLSNGFIVENCDSATPSLNNKIFKVFTYSNENKICKSNKPEKNSIKPVNTTASTNNVKRSKNKARLGERTEENESNLTPEDMLTWAEFKLPEPILKALAELGFKQPTKIQQLTLPAAVHGRRDILGAAETGSGKTLAFGLPILAGIMSLKAKAEAKGMDVYDIPYKKTSNKKKKEPEIKKPMKKIINKKDNKNDKQAPKLKESFEEGYSTAEDSEAENEEENQLNNNKTNSVKLKNIAKTRNKIKQNDNRVQSAKTNGNKIIINKTKVTKLPSNDDDYLEEIEVPLIKRDASEEFDESDGSDDNYIHLSDMLDSDDLADSSSDDDTSNFNDNIKSDDDNESVEVLDNDISEDEDNGSNSPNDSNENDLSENETSEESDANNDDESGSELENDDKDSGEEIEDSGDEGDEAMIEDEGGIGCVKVIDNIDIPAPVVTKTGKPLYALILTPTRELAIQISNHLKAAAKYTGIRIATIVGGMASVKQERLLQCGPEVVVATPGRLWQLLQQGQPHLQQLDCVKFLAIDETDRMIERGHFEELQPLLERLNVDDDRRSSRQNFVFSATLTMVHELPAHIKGKKVTKRGKIINRKIEKMTPQQKIHRLIKMIGMTDPKVVDITTKNLGTAETLTESKIACSLEHKDAYLYYILKRHPGRTIVFCNSIGCVKRLSQLFTILKCRPLPLYASLPQKQRLKNLERFRDDPHGVLISTDVAARGLDIPDIDHVIHYQVPRTAENYVHRSGRTARATKEGLTILMMEPAEAFLYTKLCRTLNKTTDLPTFPISPTTLSPLKDLVAVAREIDVLELKRRRTTQALSWRDKAARDMDMIVDDDDLYPFF